MDSNVYKHGYSTLQKPDYCDSKLTKSQKYKFPFLFYVNKTKYCNVIMVTESHGLTKKRRASQVMTYMFLPLFVAFHTKFKLPPCHVTVMRLQLKQKIKPNNLAETQSTKHLQLKSNNKSI